MEKNPLLKTICFRYIFLATYFQQFRLIAERLEAHRLRVRQFISGRKAVEKMETALARIGNWLHGGSCLLGLDVWLIYVCKKWWTGKQRQSHATFPIK